MNLKEALTIVAIGVAIGGLAGWLAWDARDTQANHQHQVECGYTVDYYKNGLGENRPLLVTDLWCFHDDNSTAPTAKEVLYCYDAIAKAMPNEIHDDVMLKLEQADNKVTVKLQCRPYDGTIRLME